VITKENVTVAEAEKDLAELEADYRKKKKFLRALLAVLKDEQPKEAKTDGK